MKTKGLLILTLALILSLAGSVGLDAKKKKDRCDLIVRSLSAPSSADAGTKIRVISRVKNKGKIKAKGSYTRFYLSRNKTVGKSDYYLGKAKVPSLKKKKSSKKKKSYLKISESVPAGRYYLIAMADGTKKNKERSEKNNYRKRRIVINEKFEVAGLKINPDYTDPFIGRVEFNATEKVPFEAIEYYGSKSEEAINIESALVYVEGYDSPVSMHFDEFGRPHQMNANDGSGIKIDYEGTNAHVHFLGTDGSFGVSTVPMGEEILPAAVENEEVSSVRSSSESSTVRNFVSSQPLGYHSTFRSSESVSPSNSVSGQGTQGRVKCNEWNGNVLTVCAPVFEMDIIHHITIPGHPLIARPPYDLHIKNISCAPFNCTFTLEDVLPYKKKLRVYMHTTVNMTAEQGDTAYGTCKTIKDKLQARTKTLKKVGGVLTDVVGLCGLWKASKVAAAVAGTSADVAWDVYADFLTRSLDEADCNRVGRALLAYNWLKDTSTEIEVEFHSANYKIDKPIFISDEFKPYSQIGPWWSNNLFLNAVEEKFISIPSREKCGCSEIPGIQKLQSYRLKAGLLEDGLQIAASSESEQPQPLYIEPFYKPEGVKSKCDPPTAHSQSVTTEQDTPVTITLKGTDPNDNSLTYTVMTQPAHGKLSGSPPTLTYTPNTGYTGSDSFTFKVNNGLKDSKNATVSITVKPAVIKWHLKEVRINPSNEPTSFAGGPNGYPDGWYWDPRYEGKTAELTITATSFSLHDKATDHCNVPEWCTVHHDATVTASFEAPKSTLESREKITLKMTASHGGSVNSGGGPSFIFHYTGNRNNAFTYAPWNPYWQGGSTATFDVTVPTAYKNGETVISAVWWNCGACRVDWVYKAE